MVANLFKQMVIFFNQMAYHPKNAPSVSASINDRSPIAGKGRNASPKVFSESTLEFACCTPRANHVVPLPALNISGSPFPTCCRDFPNTCLHFVLCSVCIFWQSKSVARCTDSFPGMLVSVLRTQEYEHHIGAERKGRTGPAHGTSLMVDMNIQVGLKNI